MSGRLLLRGLRAEALVVALLALLVAGSALLAVGGPSLRADAATRGLRSALGDAPAAFRDLVAATAAPVVSGPPGAEAAPYLSLVRRLEGRARASLERAAGPAAATGAPVLRPASWSVDTAVVAADVGAPRSGPQRWFSLSVSQEWPRHVRLVAGRLPGPATPASLPGPFAVGEPGRVPAAVDVVLTSRAAELMQLRPGDSFRTAPRQQEPLAPLTLRLVGLVEPLDRADSFWASTPPGVSALVPRYFYSDGTGAVYTGVAFTGVASLPVLAVEEQLARVTTTVRLPVDPDAAAGVDPRRLVVAVRGATSGAELLDTTGAGRVLFQPTTRLDEVLVGLLRARAPVDALTGLLLATLLAAAGIVLALAGRLLLDRRREAVALVRSRGASGAQVLGLLAVEALVLALPAAVVGAAAGLALPGAPGGLGWALLGVVVLAPVPAVVAAAVPLVRGPRRPARGAATGGRSGLAGWALARAGRRAAPAVGAALLLLAATAAAVALRRRGLAASGPVPVAAAGLDGVPSLTLDPLVVAAPVLLAAVVAVVAGRLVAGPVAVAARAASRRGGAVAFLGLARARREGRGPLALVCLALCLAVSLLVVVTTVTADRATRAAAAADVAAPLRVDGFGFTDADVAALRAVPGAGVVAPRTLVPDASVSVPGTGGATAQEVDVDLVGTEPRVWAAVQARLPVLPGVGVLAPAEAARLAAPADPAAPLPVAVGPAVAASGGRPGATVSLRVGARRLDARVAVVASGFAGVPTDGAWVLADLAALRARTGLVLAPQQLLASGVAGTPLPAPSAVTSVLAAAGDVRTPGAAASAVARSPLARALRSALPVTLAVAVVLALLAVALTLLLGARSRSRFVAHLRAVGLSGRQAAGLVVLEVVPVVAGALLGGLAGGALLARLVLPVADLRPVTGALLPPPVVVPWAGTSLLGLGFLGAAAVGVVAAVVAGRALSPAAAARTVEGD